VLLLATNCVFDAVMVDSGCSAARIKTTCWSEESSSSSSTF